MTAFDSAPSSLDTVTSPAWLTAMLRTRWPGVEVRGAEIVELLATQATKVRLRLDTTGDAGAPTTICIKGVLTDTGASLSTSIVETLFYQHTAARLPVHVPPCVYASLNADSSNGVLVMEDVIAAGGRFCTALVPFTPEQARDGLDALAALHAATWHDTPLYSLPFVPRFLEMIGTRPIMPMEALQALLDGPRGDPLPPAVRRAEPLQAALQSLTAQLREVPNCLVHGDAHAGNVFRDADGTLGIVDWQVLQQGEWAQDVAYHIAAVLTPEDRPRHERDLLDHYLQTLADLGGPSMDREQAWTRYRAGLVYGFYLWAITRKVEPEITNEFNRRLGLAVHDLDSFAAAGAPIS